ncbi:transcription factor [Phlyctema vagabunda]|uniref:Transcription factor n=1 Tax=Phlyctema vagabunda TaxID=108571 RepID=A0ABR4PC88_9HELO
MEAQSLSECNQCGKKFQRKAHLLRHQQQHSGDRPYSCKFCSKTFKRSDVLRDHFSRCDRRGTSAIPSSLERGRKRHACDECSRLKVKCDNETPCRKCREFGRTCVKNRPPNDAPAASSPDAEVGTPDVTTSPDTTGSARNSIGFLLNCPKDTDFMVRFPKSTTMSPNTKVANFTNLISGGNGYNAAANGLSVSLSHNYEYFANVGGGNNIDTLLSNLEFESFERRQAANWSGIQMPGILWPGADAMYMDRSVLEQRSLEIRQNLYRAAAQEFGPPSLSKELVDAIELLTADNIAAFIKLYFRHWHKHGPIVHEPSFNPCIAAIPLVLALMALGAMYSKDPIEVSKIKLLLDVIESFIYSLPGLSEEYDSPGRIYSKPTERATPEWKQYQLEEMQGAYLMIVLQYWTGSETARKRVRQSRFTRIVEIYRYLGMNKVQHPLEFKIVDEQSFKTWIQKEAYIRTATIAMMLDNAFGIFNNITPRLQVKHPGILPCFGHISILTTSLLISGQKSTSLFQARIDFFN